ncbi:MAG: addiction module antidote protein, HigA family [Lentisphaerae bacterium RIFOXYB12_FULL_65_16]|nr:MAG: addiction module antidote protein, HigA family [Lentisphaerae bacterium RIFOXYA12_64_32]OGV89050.1 MAG: addiction module antidote protein, HigA family [Lentisphaerae bacterium RIFOXYB12_FULL_65_16]
MIPKHRMPTSPGEILAEEFLAPLGITQTALARHIGVPVRRVNEIVRGKRAISPETAQLLAAALGPSPCNAAPLALDVARPAGWRYNSTSKTAVRGGPWRLLGNTTQEHCTGGV